MNIQYRAKGFENERTVIVGIDNNAFGKQYRIITFKMTENTSAWKYERRIVDENTLINVINMGGKIINAELDAKGRLKGEPASFSRFEKSQLVIISELVNDNNIVVGYKVARSDGSVRNIKLAELVAYGFRCEQNGLIPVQNAIFVADSKDKKPHYKAYKEGQFIVEKLPSNSKVKFNNKLEKAPEKEKTIDKAQYVRDIYTDEQLKELKAGKDNGIDFRIYSNPALSAEQMHVLRGGLEQGLNVKPYAYPEYDINAMKYYIDEQSEGFNISTILSPEYTIEQLSELTLALEDGLDVMQMNDPSKTAEEMAEIRLRLELGIYKEMDIKKHSSWK